MLVRPPMVAVMQLKASAATIVLVRYASASASKHAILGQLRHTFTHLSTPSHAMSHVTPCDALSTVLQYHSTRSPLLRAVSLAVPAFDFLEQVNTHIVCGNDKTQRQQECLAVQCIAELVSERLPKATVM